MREKEVTTVAGIVEVYIQENGYDGLYDPYKGCGCKLGNLFPCGGEWVERCIPGKATAEGLIVAPRGDE